MRRLISRTATLALCVTVTLGAAAVPCAAGEPAATKTAGKMTQLSPASRQLLATPATAVAQLASPKLRSSEGGQAPAATPSSPSSFFKSTRGKVTLALMGAGVGFALYSIHHDRIPVKSPVR